MRSEEISWKIGETTVAGTVTFPDEAGTYPSVVFIAGSGPTDRNWETPLIPGANGSARLLAEALTAKGYVTLRYDKRGTGPCGQENLSLMMGKYSMESHFEELQGAVSCLLDFPQVDPQRLFVLTSSEGALHALYYQTHAGVRPFDGMILTGAPGRPLNEVTGYQVVSQLEPLPHGQDLIARYRKLIAGFENGQPFAPDPVLPEAINVLVASLSTPANQPFTREFWAFDPAVYIRKINVPVLVVIGKKDLQVDWKLDGEVLEKAAEGKDHISFFYPENASHVLKYEPVPREELTMDLAMRSYSLPGTVLDSETLEAIAGWLAQRQ